MRRALPVAVMIFAVAAGAGAADMVLTRQGTLYRAAYAADAGIVITEQGPGGTLRDLAVPLTASTDATAIHLDADAATGGLYVVWQSGIEPDTRVELAWFHDESWYGPYVLAGGDGAVAHSPEMRFHRTSTSADWFDADGNAVTVDVEMPFLHVVWWQRDSGYDAGVAVYQAIPVDEAGLPNLGDRPAVALAKLLPYGIGCPGIDDVTELASPRLLVDPQSGNPHVMATDLADCLIQILELDAQLADEPDLDPKRRRHVIILRTQEMLYVNPDLPLASAEAEVGHGLSVVLHWDTGDAVEYIQLEGDLWSDIRSLPLTDELDHEKAVDLIRSLVR